MIDINNLHTIIKRLIRKKHGGFTPPGVIDKAINMASIDLFNQQMKEYRQTGRLPELLKNFKREATGTTTGNKLTISSEDAEIIAVQGHDGTNYYPCKIVTDQEWVERKIEMMELDPNTGKPYGFYIEEVEVTANNQELGQDVLGLAYANLVEDATGFRHEALVVDAAKFESKKLEDIFPDMEVSSLSEAEIPPTFINKKETVWTSDGSGSSSEYSNAPIVINDLSYGTSNGFHYIFNGIGDASWTLPAGSSRVKITNNTTMYFVSLSANGAETIGSSNPYEIGPETTIEFIWVDSLNKWVVEA